jgi:hypothetical protein
MPVIRKNGPQGKNDEKEHLKGDALISRKILFLHHLLREENRQTAHQQAIGNANRADDFIAAEGPGVCKKKHGK